MIVCCLSSRLCLCLRVCVFARVCFKDAFVCEVDSAQGPAKDQHVGTPEVLLGHGADYKFLCLSVYVCGHGTVAILAQAVLAQATRLGPRVQADCGAQAEMVAAAPAAAGNSADSGAGFATQASRDGRAPTFAALTKRRS